MSSQRKTPGPQQQTTARSGGVDIVRKVLIAGTVCTALAGCPKKLGRPPIQGCPDATYASMKEHHLIGGGPTEVVGASDDLRVTVREGAAVLSNIGVGNSHEMVRNRSHFYGQFIMGEDRVFGHFTRMQLPDGSSLKVCLEMVDGMDLKRGALKREGSTGDAARIHSIVFLELMHPSEEP